MPDEYFCNLLYYQPMQKKSIGMRLTMLALSIAGVFAVPAIIGALIGRFFDKRYGTGEMWTIILLFVAFLISWILVIVAYKRSEKRLKSQNGGNRQSSENT